MTGPCGTVGQMVAAMVGLITRAAAAGALAGAK
jgi:hypothetical protein